MILVQSSTSSEAKPPSIRHKQTDRQLCSCECNLAKLHLICCTKELHPSLTHLRAKRYCLRTRQRTTPAAIGDTTCYIMCSLREVKLL